MTTYKVHNKKLAVDLWGFGINGQTWEYIYFLDEILSLNISISEFNKCVGYQPNFIIQGFNVLDEIKSQKLLNKFNLSTDTYYPDVANEEYEKVLDQLNRLDETEEQCNVLRRKEQAYLKKILFGNKLVSNCCFCGSSLPIQFLVISWDNTKIKLPNLKELLADGNPSIEVMNAENGSINVTVHMLKKGQVRMVADRIR